MPEEKYDNGPNNPERPSLKLGKEADAASKILDLTNVPLKVELFQLISAHITEEALDLKINNEFAQLQRVISDSIPNPKIGYLLEVSIYKNELGNIVIPSGQMIYPVGVGTEPIDAYSEFLRKPRIRSEVPTGLKNETIFLWVKKTDNALHAYTIPPEFSSVLINESLAEADRRNQVGEWHRTFPLNNLKVIELAEYWSEVQKTHGRLIRDAEHKRKTEELSNKMQTLQTQANVLYTQYQTVLSDMARHQKFQQTLNTISTVSGLIQQSIELGALVCSTDLNPVTGSDIPPSSNIPATIEFTHRETIILEGKKHEISRGLKLKFENLKDVQSGLGEIFKKEGIPLPQSRPFEFPPL